MAWQVDRPKWTTLTHSYTLTPTPQQCDAQGGEGEHAGQEAAHGAEHYFGKGDPPLPGPP